MATFLEVTNRVLKRLREDAATDVNQDTLVSIVSDMVADMQDDMIGRHAWSNLFANQVITLADATATYTLAISPNSELAQEPGGGPNVYYFESGDTQAAGYMYVTTQQELTQMKARQGDQTGQPCYIAFTPNYVAGNYTVEVFPVPTAGEAGDTIEAEFFVVPARLAANDDALSVPDRPVFLGAYYQAVNERGEEIGEPIQIVERRAVDALGEAIENDIPLRERVNRYEAYRD
ncbi:MAG: hypothetical protein QNJ97_17850 [Myxococcota bacterium]|nr:hypothetical protein [Myxococcota bacterium]